MLGTAGTVERSQARILMVHHGASLLDLAPTGAIFEILQSLIICQQPLVSAICVEKNICSSITTTCLIVFSVAVKKNGGFYYNSTQE